VRHIKTTKTTHYLELDGDELMMLLQGEGDGPVMEDEENFKLEVILPSGGDYYSGMTLLVEGNLKFIATWEDDTDEEVEQLG